MRPRRRVFIGNRSEGGLWWRAPLAAIIWLSWAAPFVVALWVVFTLRGYAADLPAVPDLDRWDRDASRTSVMVAADGTVVAEQPFQIGVEVGHRFTVDYDDLPPRLIRAVLAAEDIRFFSHNGVDVHAVVRAAWANYRAGKVVEGASTITQQVARNLLPAEIGNERSMRRKVREALLARRIERRYSKQRIFEVYVNHAFLGAGAYGVAAAARAYFDKSLSELDLAETALIAGMAQAPGRANPFVDREAARARRDQVLARMERAGFASADEVAAAVARPIELSPPPMRYGTVAPWHTERARREIETELSGDYLRGGLRIETSALPVLSARAEAEVRERARALGKGREHGAPQIAALVWDHRTGYVEATVGGLSWETSKFDRATQACRQPGSAFKPILYAAAIERGVITAGTPLRDVPIAEYDDETGVFWKPRSSGRFRGVALAHDALVASLNPPAVDVLDRVGPAAVAELARRLGVTSELTDLRPMALGASCVIPIELAGAFTAFARGGTVAEHHFVVRVTRGDEVLVDRASPYDPWLDPARRLDRVAATAGAGDDRSPAIEPSTAFIVSNMLRDVVARGTATAARRLPQPVAGKTGTTNDNTDAWFVGYTGRMVAAVWVGHDDPAKPLGRRDDGSHAALPVWIALERLAEGDRAAVELPGEPPAGMVSARVDRETGLLAQPGAGGAITLYFAAGTEPTTRVGASEGVPTDLGRASREF